MVEMTETANILNNATAAQLVILDEIGRGTSTYDGISIAWSVVEYLHYHVGCRTLFATHYHELTDLEKSLSGVKNLNVAVREWQDEVVFLHKIIEGAADKSYGIHVARLAGVPREVVSAARRSWPHSRTSTWMLRAARRSPGRVRAQNDAHATHALRAGRVAAFGRIAPLGPRCHNAALCGLQLLKRWQESLADDERGPFAPYPLRLFQPFLAIR